MSFIRLEGVTKVYPNGVRALECLTLTVDQGEWVAIMGPSGAGKSTLLHLIGGLDQPTEGSIWVDNVPVDRLKPVEAARYRRHYIGLVFQQFHLVPYLTALENVMLAQYFHSVPDEDQAREVLAQVGLAHRLHHYPAQLSSGEQQRVAIARAIINDPPIILADEPTGSLDEESERVVLNLFQEIHARGKTILLVTHAPHVARLAGRCIILEHGRLISLKTPERIQQSLESTDVSPKPISENP